MGTDSTIGSAPSSAIALVSAMLGVTTPLAQVAAAGKRPRSVLEDPTSERSARVRCKDLVILPGIDPWRMNSSGFDPPFHRRRSPPRHDDVICPTQT